jgi:hypothetical protein
MYKFGAVFHVEWIRNYKCLDSDQQGPNRVVHCPGPKLSVSQLKLRYNILETKLNGSCTKIRNGWSYMRKLAVSCLAVCAQVACNLGLATIPICRYGCTYYGHQLYQWKVWPVRVWVPVVSIPYTYCTPVYGHAIQPLWWWWWPKTRVVDHISKLGFEPIANQYIYSYLIEAIDAIETNRTDRTWQIPHHPSSS